MAVFREGRPNPGVTVSPAADVVKWRAAEAGGAGGGGGGGEEAANPMRLYEEQGNI